MSTSRTLHTNIFLGMLVGVVLGLISRFTLAHDPALDWLVQNVAQPLGQIFLRLIFMVVIPLVIAALALGVTEMGDAKRVGRVGLKTLLLTLVFSGAAVLIGVAGVNLVQPGVGLSEASRSALSQTLHAEDALKKVDQAKLAKPAAQALVELIPKNPFVEAVNAFEGGLIPLMVLALILGLAMTSVGTQRARPLQELLESVFAVTIRIIEMAMKLAPLGVGALMFVMTATLGADALWLLGKYALLVLVLLAIQLVVVYGLAIRFLAGRSPVAYFKELRDVMLTAFSTSSSNATLPLALSTATEKLKLPRHISHFVLTVGATANQNGTALFEGVTVLFLAQFFGIDLTFQQQLTVVFMSILAGVGTAGVPGGSLPLIVVVLQSIGVPGEGIGLILGVDRLLDMSRTVINVAGDLTIATCVAANETADDPHAAPHPVIENH